MLLELRNDPAPDGIIDATFRALPMLFFSFFRQKRSKKAGCHKAPFLRLNFGVLPNNYLKAGWLLDSPLIFASFSSLGVKWF